MSERRNIFFDVLKGFSIFLVVWGHCIQALHIQWEQSVAAKAIYMFHMPLFMAISGYFFYPSVAKVDFVSFVKKKFFRLYLPSLSWGCFSVILIGGGGKILKHGELDLFYFADILFSGLWFLTVLFILSVIGATIHHYFTENRLTVWMLLFAVFYMAPDYWMVNELKFLMPFFVMAIYVKKHEIERLPVWIYITGTLLFLCMFNIYTFEDSLYKIEYKPFTLDYHIKSLIRYTSGFSGIICSLLICRLLCKYTFVSGLLSYIGMVTLPIYALHQKFLLPNKVIGYQSENVLVTIIAAAIVIALSISLYNILRKNKLIRILLFGEK